MGYANTNIATQIGGDTYEFGTPAGRATEHDWEGVRAVLANGGSREYVGLFDDFLGDAIATPWDEDLSTGAAVAINAAQNGTIRFTTDTDDNDHATLALGLHWLVSKGLTVFEARVAQITAITLRAVEIGLSDAVSETNGLAFSSHDATPVDVADNAAVFAINSDESVATWSLLSVNAGTPQRSDSAVAPVAGTFQGFRIVIDELGNAEFFIDSDGDEDEYQLVGRHSLAVASTAVLTPWITLKSLSGAIKTMDVDYIGIYGKR